MARIDVSLRMHEQSEHAAALLKKQGFRLTNKPDMSIPVLPEDITSIGDEDLMDLFVELTAWNDYISVQVACAQIDERAAQRVLDYAEATALAGAHGGSSADRVAVSKAKVAIDPEVRRIREDLDEKYAYRKLVETLAGNVERDAALVSRELTRRTSGVTPARRAQRWSS